MTTLRISSACNHQWKVKPEYIPGFGDEICRLCGMQRKDEGTKVTNYNPNPNKPRAARGRRSTDVNPIFARKAAIEDIKDAVLMLLALTVYAASAVLLAYYFGALWVK
jgi:hypothetical protein